MSLAHKKFILDKPLFETSNNIQAANKCNQFENIAVTKTAHRTLTISLYSN